MKISHGNRNFVDIKEMPSSKILQGRCERNNFLVGFSLTFPRFPRKFKNRLNTSLLSAVREILNVYFLFYV